MKLSHTLLSLAILTTACDQDSSAPAPEEEVAALEIAAEPPADGPLRTAQARAKHHADAMKPHATMPGAKVAFDELSSLIEAKYVGGPLTEDELWTGAMEGVLARLVQLPGHEINTLLSPRDHKELLIGTKGRLVGVGVMIERVANVVVIRDVIDGGPAANAGLRAGDRILGVDDERLEPLDLAAVVDRIRGEDGSEVRLFVQRDTEEWTETITRGLVEVKSVESKMVGEGTGLVRITSFSEKTAAELDAGLAALEAAGATSVVLDLRHCPGGLLDAALEVGSRFVPEGKPLLTVNHRAGDPDVHLSKGSHPWQDRPLAVLIGPKTASGAEILADALREHDRGPLVGEPTLGKHTVESIHELSSGWAVKLSVSRFATASGEQRQGIGVRPDIPIPMGDAKEKIRSVDDIDPSADPVVATALGLLGVD